MRLKSDSRTPGLCVPRLGSPALKKPKCNCRHFDTSYCTNTLHSRQAEFNPKEPDTNHIRKTRRLLSSMI